MEVKIMKVENNYPKIKKEVDKFLIFRRIMLIIFLVSIITCSIVNLSVGGKKWMFYVLGGEIIFYFAILNKPLIDNTLIKRITIVIMIVCAYLYMIDIIEETSFSYFVINIILFSIIIFQLILFLSEFKLQRKKFIPLFFTATGAIIFCILALTKVVELNWPIIVLGGVGLLSIIILLVFYHKRVIKDLTKYFSIK